MWWFRKEEKTMHFEEVHTMDDSRLKCTYLATQIMIPVSDISITLHQTGAAIFTSSWFLYPYIILYQAGASIFTSSWFLYPLYLSYYIRLVLLYSHHHDSCIRYIYHAISGWCCYIHIIILLLLHFFSCFSVYTYCGGSEHSIAKMKMHGAQTLTFYSCVWMWRRPCA